MKAHDFDDWRKAPYWFTIKASVLEVESSICMFGRAWHELVNWKSGYHKTARVPSSANALLSLKWCNAIRHELCSPIELHILQVPCSCIWRTHFVSVLEAGWRQQASFNLQNWQQVLIPDLRYIQIYGRAPPPHSSSLQDLNSINSINELASCLSAVHVLCLNWCQMVLHLRVCCLKMARWETSKDPV